MTAPNPAYQVIIVPSSEDEELFANAKTIADALAIMGEHDLPDVNHLTSFKTEAEMHAFLQGYQAAIGHLGEGLAFFEVNSEQELKLKRIKALEQYLDDTDTSLEIQYEILIDEKLDGNKLLGDIVGVDAQCDFMESSVDNLINNLLP